MSVNEFFLIGNKKKISARGGAWTLEFEPRNVNRQIQNCGIEENRKKADLLSVPSQITCIVSVAK